jgi:hypothetical protein
MSVFVAAAGIRPHIKQLTRPCCSLGASIIAAIASEVRSADRDSMKRDGRVLITRP